jgi:hypothetical protein
MLMILLGITGPIGHGKSTFADALTEFEPSSVRLESSLIIAELANAMHSTLSTIPKADDLKAINDWLRTLPAMLLEQLQTHATIEQLEIKEEQIQQHPVEYQKLLLHLENLARNPELAHQPISKENKESYRPFLQWLGGYLVQHVDQQIWYKEIIRQAYKAETDGCKLCIIGGVRFPQDAALIRQAGGFVIKVYRPGHLQSDILDPTERERENIPVNATVMSDGSIDALKRCAKDFLKDLTENKLQQLYQTAKYEVHSFRLTRG